ncbi:MAG: LysM peptidoglycan-binding domain-containing protein [Acidimicrobiia bacterium]
MTMNAKTLRRAAVLLTTIVVFFLLLANAVGAQDRVQATARHQVAVGETLWGIAQTATPGGGDIRVTVSEIRRLNDLDGATIYPGDVLVVPTG